MEKIMNQYLADLVVEYHKLQNFHWYIKGYDFFEVHAKLEELYNGINSAIDEVAEAILMEEGKPLASLKDFLSVSKIKEQDAADVHSDVVLASVLEDFKYLLASSIEIKKQADEKNSYMISAMMDGYIIEYKKSLWMLSSLNK